MNVKYELFSGINKSLGAVPADVFVDNVFRCLIKSTRGKGSSPLFNDQMIEQK